MIKTNWNTSVKFPSVIHLEFMILTKYWQNNTKISFFIANLDYLLLKRSLTSLEAFLVNNLRNCSIRYVNRFFSNSTLLLTLLTTCGQLWILSVFWIFSQISHDCFSKRWVFKFCNPGCFVIMKILFSGVYLILTVRKK